MKKSILIFSSVLLSISSLHAAELTHQEKATRHYNAALKLEKSGDVKQAIKHLKKAIQHSPEFIKARQKLTVLSAKAPQLIQQQKLKALEKVNVANIDLEGDSLDDALKKVMQTVKTYNKKHGTSMTTNVVVNDPAGKFEKVKINLKVQNVPAKVVLDNIMLLAGAKYSVEPYFLKVIPSS